MDMPRCKTCKWWGKYRHGVCDLIQECNPPIADNSAQIAVRVSDDHGLEIWFVTGPEFGCIHHQEKEK